VKPENLLFESDAPDAHLKLVDFGLSCLRTIKEGEAISPVGSVLYMAPERFANEATEKSDIWSAGVVLFIMLSGRIPFQGKTDAETILRIKSKAPALTGKSWEGISDGAKVLVQRMLNKDPALRPTAEMVLMDPWLFSFTKNTISDDLYYSESVLNLNKFYVTLT
jgi:calcium-dependent protein kinase